jgi:guanylate kinase
MQGNIIVLSGPSGSGKSTIRAKLLKIFPDIEFSISYTTRQPRKEKSDKLDYYFITRNQFKEMIKKDEFVEWAEVHGDRYGTPARQILSTIDEGRHILLEIDVQGGFSIKKKFPEAILIFIIPPTFEELEKRLRERAMNSITEIKKRLQVAKKEIAAAKNYDYIVINDSLKHCIEQINAIIISYRCKSQFQIPFINRLLSDTKA